MITGDSAMARQRTQTQAQHIDQLNKLIAIQASPPDFRVGQLVRRSMLSLPISDRDVTHLTIAAVLEVVPNMRAHTGKWTDTNGPAIRLAHLDEEGSYAESFCEAWMYEPISPEQIAAITGETAH
jgi:hypothetical protein